MKFQYCEVSINLSISTMGNFDCAVLFNVPITSQYIRQTAKIYIFKGVNHITLFTIMLQWNEHTGEFFNNFTTRFRADVDFFTMSPGAMH